MNDLFDIRPTNKEMAIGILGVFILLVVVFSAGYLLGIRNVHDNGSGTEPISTELGNAGAAISNAGEGIQAAQGTADAISGTIKDAQSTADYIHGTAKDSTELIGQCQSIIEAIRRRGKKEAN